MALEALRLSIEEVLQNSAPTVRHIPSATIEPGSNLMETLIQELVEMPSCDTAFMFFCFLKLVLRAGSGWKVKGALTAVDIVRRVRLWCSGPHGV